MKQLSRVLLVCSLLLGLASWDIKPVLSQGAGGAGVRYFDETGHNVQGDFLAFFNRYGGEAVFGLPRTEEFFQDGLKVQYFQRARMEHHPANPPPYQVQLTLLGDMMNYRLPPIPALAIPAPNHPQRRYYPQTGHTLSYAFLWFFDGHGGLDAFGYPITELLVEHGTVVQYFQRARMEWHPENPIVSQITLGNLGDEYIDYTGLPPIHLQRSARLTSAVEGPALTSQVWSTPPISAPTADAPQPTAPPVPTPEPPFSGDLHVSISVKYPITGQGGYQTVYVWVMDDWEQPVSGAAVEIVVHFRTGDQLFRAPATDSSGHSSLTFGIGHPSPGCTVLLDARVTYRGHAASESTSFIPWW